MRIKNVEDLISHIDRGGKAKYIFFWGHQQRDNEADQSCLSQWFPAPFEHASESFRTAEHFMMYRKAELFGDSDIAAQILVARSPGDAKALGRKVRGFKENAWIESRWEIAVSGNYEKFSQNEQLRTYLLATGTRVLVEASPVDPIWGIGLDRSAALDLHPGQWQGENILGFVLMEVRNRLLDDAEQRQD